jgi:protein-L-isoaspartate(D-aspartate) O-methyltransferase
VEIPEPLLQQMAIGGIMIVPVGGRYEQQLIKVTRTDSGYEQEVLEAVVFVPFLAGTN